MFNHDIQLGGLGCQGDQRQLEAENKALVCEIYAAIDAQDYDQVGNMMTEDFRLVYVGMPKPLSKDQTLELIRGFYFAFPDSKHAIETIVADHDVVAASFTYHATHQGVFEGIPPTGNRVEYSGAQIIKIVGGKIAECWALEDNLGLMSQLGMQLTPAEPGT